MHITNATPLRVPWLIQLQRRNTDALGFLPLPSLRHAVDEHRVHVALIHDQPIGFIFTGSTARPVLRIFQVCVIDHHRDHGVGAALVRHVEDAHRGRGGQSTFARCAADLPAIDFWISLGYTCTGAATGGTRRNRTLNIFEKSLTPAVASAIARRPVRRPATSSPWRQARRQQPAAGPNPHRAVAELGPRPSPPPHFS